MSLKILCVDDTNTIQKVLKRIFKPYDVELIEAFNGIEGLAMAKKHLPNLILLDVNMPEMDGIEMLTQLKQDDQLKNLPVIILTAEMNRENVLKIAKIGIRDYIIKPFTEGVIVQKASRILQLTRNNNTAELTSTAPLDPKAVIGSKHIQGEAECILVVEDQPAVVQQIREGLTHTFWNIQGVEVPTVEAVKEFCKKTLPSAVLISLALPNQEAIQIFRFLRSNQDTKLVPILGLAVKLDVDAQTQAKQLGFSDIVTKPIQLRQLELKIKWAKKEDILTDACSTEADCLVIRLPENVSPNLMGKLEISIKEKIVAAVNAGVTKTHFYFPVENELNLSFVALMEDIVKTCAEAGLANVELVCSSK